MVDSALAALGYRQPFVGAGETCQDRQARGIGRRITERTKIVRVIIPYRFLRGMPFAISVAGLIQ